MSDEAAGYDRPDEGGETEEGTMTYWVYEDDPTNGRARRTWRHATAPTMAGE